MKRFAGLCVLHFSFSACRGPGVLVSGSPFSGSARVSAHRISRDCFTLEYVNDCAGERGEIHTHTCLRARSYEDTHQYKVGR